MFKKKKKKKKHLKRPQTRPNIFICLLDHVDVGPLANIKIERQRRLVKLLLSGRSGSQYVSMVSKLVYSYRGVNVVGSYCIIIINININN